MKGLVKNREFMNMGNFFNIRKLIAATLLFAEDLSCGSRLQPLAAVRDKGECDRLRSTLAH